MANIKLSKFITNLEKFKKDPIKDFEKTLYEILYHIFSQIAMYTITDTGESKRKVLEVVAKILKRDVNNFKETVYNYWENNYEREHREWGSNLGDVNISENSATNKYNLNVTINDDGLFAQQNASGSPGAASGKFQGYNYPSKELSQSEGRDNSPYRIRHITYVTDLFNSGKYGQIDNLEWNKLISDLIKDIEKGLFK